MSEAQYPQITFNPYDGTLRLVIPDGSTYFYQTPFGNNMGHVPPFIHKWERAIKSQPSNVYKVVLKSINQLIQSPDSNWKIIQKNKKPGSVNPTPAPNPEKSQQFLPGF